MSCNQRIHEKTGTSVALLKMWLIWGEKTFRPKKNETKVERLGEEEEDLTKIFIQQKINHNVLYVEWSCCVPFGKVSGGTVLVTNEHICTNSTLQ